MATTFNCTEEVGLLRRAVAEPVRQFIVVEYDTLARLQQVLDELVALDPTRAHVIHKFDFRKDNAAELLQIIREKLKAASGSRPAILALIGPDEIETKPGTPASHRFWKEMNLAREALNYFDAQIILCLERWSYRQALQLADHLLSWAAMKVHLIGANERPAIADRTALSAGLFGNYKLSPEVALERWHELELGWVKAREHGEPPEGFPQRFFIPMLEAALSLGDLLLARKTRELAQVNGQFQDQDMPRWHELNLALALAEHEDGRADEHAHKLLDLAENHSDERVRERALKAVNRQAKVLTDTAAYELAEPLFRKSLALAEKNYGANHQEVALRLNNLANLLLDTNRLAEAEPIMRRGLQIQEDCSGKDHPLVAIHLNNLAQLLKAANRLSEAEPLMRRTLSMVEEKFGLEHPRVATSLANLAGLLQDTNRLAEAEPLYRRALAIDEKNYGLEHPDVATDLNNLATLLQDTNRLKEAEPLLRRSLAISEKSFGSEHPAVATCRSNLAMLLLETSRLKEAEQLSFQAVNICSRSFGLEHPKTKAALNVYRNILSNLKLVEPEIQAKLQAATGQSLQ